jgi:hypothetical protein
VTQMLDWEGLRRPHLPSWPVGGYREGNGQDVADLRTMYQGPKTKDDKGPMTKLGIGTEPKEHGGHAFLRRATVSPFVAVTSEGFWAVPIEKVLALSRHRASTVIRVRF